MDDSNYKVSLHRINIFHPRGYVLLVFNSHQMAESTLAALLQGGYDETEIVRYHSADMLSLAEHLREHATVFARIGYEVNLLERYEKLARENCCFLEVYAPSRAETARVLRVAKRFAVRQAEKYANFVIEDLVP